MQVGYRLQVVALICRSWANERNSWSKRCCLVGSLVCDVADVAALAALSTYPQETK
jgi:hypothetical protein